MGAKSPSNSRPSGTTKRKSSGGFRLHSFLLKSIIFVALFHYGLLVLLYHGFLNVDDTKEILQMAQDFVENRNATSTSARRTTSNTKPWKVLWAIESKNTDEEKRRRQALRETYLTYSPQSDLASNGSDDDDDDDNTKNQGASNPNTSSGAGAGGGGSSIFCSLRDVQNNKLNATNIDACVFYYVFVIRDNFVTTTAFFNEPDVDVWNDDENKASAQTLFNYTLEKNKKIAGPASSNLDAVAWVQSDVMVFPIDILDSVAAFVGGNYFVQTPQNPMPQKCRNCQWDREIASRNGRFLIVSTELVRAVTQKSELSCKDGNDYYNVLRNCIVDAVGSHAVTGDLHQVGHQYQGQNAEQLHELWKMHQMSIENLQQFSRKTKVHHIAANFGRDHNAFATEIASYKTALIAHGFLPHQWALYNGNFPAFITKDYRWEEHTEFMNDMSLPDTNAGYGFWRAALVEHHWEDFADGDFIIYADTDIWNHLPFVMELLEQMQARHSNFAINANHFPENEWTKRDLYESLCIIDQNHQFFLPKDRSAQYSGSFFILRKSPGASDFVKRYLRLLQNFRLISDRPSMLPNYPEFREHRWAQSALSVLLKCKYTEMGKQLFQHDLLRDLGWFDLYTFHLSALTEV